MFLRDKFCFAVLLSFICSAQSQEEKFAGNLIPDNNADSDHTTADDDDGSERTSSVVGTNLTGSPDEVNGAPSIPESADSPPEKRSVKKAARPPGKPESVGFIPPPEEEGKGSEEEEAEERQMVMSIPTLPASIIKPGRISNGSWYIVLYASWCVHSQAALSEFLPTVQYIVDHNITEIVVGKIDIIKHSEVAKHFRVKSTPTIFFFKNGVRHSFDHPIVSTANLVDFMLEVLESKVTRVTNTSELAALKKNHSVVFMIVHDQKIDVDWQRIYMKQANDKALKAKFAVTTNPDIVEEYNFKTLPIILVFKDDTIFGFRESLTAHALSKWILVEKDVAFPIVNMSTFRKYLHPVSGRRLAFLVVNEDPYQRTASEKQAIEDVRTLAHSRRQHQKFQFGLVEGKSIPEMFIQRSVGSFPFFMALEPYTGYYFLLEPGERKGAISKKTISNFLHGIGSGEEDRFGGVTFLDQFQHIYQLGYGTIQSMLVHRPFLSLLTGLCMMGVMCFYVVICWQNRVNKPSAAEIRTKKIARARRKKEELERRDSEATRRRIVAKELAVAKSRDEMGLKRRNKTDMVQNGTAGGNGTDSGSGGETEDSDTQSGSEEDSQTER